MKQESELQGQYSIFDFLNQKEKATDSEEDLKQNDDDINQKPICKHSQHPCNREELFKIANSLDDIKCPEICCRLCKINTCGARCNGAPAPAPTDTPSLREEYDIQLPKKKYQEEDGYCDVWHYTDEEQPTDMDIYYTVQAWFGDPVWTYSAYADGKWYYWNTTLEKWNQIEGSALKISVICWMQIPVNQRRKDKSLKDKFKMEGIIC